MRKIKKLREVKLNHSCDYLSSGTLENDTFLASGNEGKITIFENEGEVINKLKLFKQIKSIDFNHNRQQIGYVDSEGISIINYDKNLLHYIEGNYDTIFINDNFLWSVKINDANNARIEIYNLEDFQLSFRLDFKDVFGHSNYMFFEGFKKSTPILWMAAGQDGQINYAANLENDELKLLELGNYHTFPINVSPDGKYFINGDSQHIDIYSYPSLILRHRINFVEEAEHINNIIYLSEDQILLHLENQMRIYNTKFNSVDIVNLFRNKEQKNLSVTEEIYRCADISYSFRFGDNILMPYKKDSVIIANKSNFEHRNKNQLELPY